MKNKKREKTADEKDKEREERYYRNIDECAREEKNVEIYHLSKKHSVYVLKTIFMRAQNEVCIFTYGLREDIFSDDGLIVEAIKFLNKHGARLKIAFKDTNPLSEKFLKSVFNASTKGKVDMWDASKNTQKNDSYFWLNDRHCFARGPQNDIANFGNKEAGQVLNNLFTGIIMKAERVFN